MLTDVTDVTQWGFTKVANYASRITGTLPGKISFGMPSITQTIYPGQSIRLPTGWGATTIPTATMIHTLPHKDLLSNGLISIPQIYTEQDAGSQISQVIYNNTKYPVKIQPIQQLARLSYINQNDQEIILGDFGDVITGFLGTAAKILPLFF